MEVVDRDAEEQPAQVGQHRVAEVAVQRRHRARLDAAGEAVAHHQVGAVAQRGRGTAPGRPARSCRRRRPSRRSGPARPRCRPAALRRSPARRPATTRAPACVASCCEPSVLPLSATTTSPLTPSRSMLPSALRTQVATVSASSRHGRTTESSHGLLGAQRSTLPTANSGLAERRPDPGLDRAGHRHDEPVPEPHGQRRPAGSSAATSSRRTRRTGRAR